MGHNGTEFENPCPTAAPQIGNNANSPAKWENLGIHGNSWGKFCPFSPAQTPHPIHAASALTIGKIVPARQPLPDWSQLFPGRACPPGINTDGPAYSIHITVAGSQTQEETTEEPESQEPGAEAGRRAVRGGRRPRPTFGTAARQGHRPGGCSRPWRPGGLRHRPRPHHGRAPADPGCCGVAGRRPDRWSWTPWLTS